MALSQCPQPGLVPSTGRELDSPPTASSSVLHGDHSTASRPGTSRTGEVERARMTCVLRRVDEVNKVGAEVVGELGEERLGLGLCQGAHCSASRVSVGA